MGKSKSKVSKAFKSSHKGGKAIARKRKHKRGELSDKEKLVLFNEILAKTGSSKGKKVKRVGLNHLIIEMTLLMTSAQDFLGNYWDRTGFTHPKRLFFIVRNEKLISGN